MENIAKFEKKVIESILKICGDSFAPKILEQYMNSTIISREFTGVGFFTHFQIEDKSLSLGNDFNLKMGGIHAVVKGLKYGAGFILYVKSGMLTMLEGYSHGDDEWPKNITGYRLYLINPDGSLSRI